ncbi:hypothetical protein GCM10023205_32660 [Yinghuangia aomiensis]|uniref:Uncharacterized protein n=1 Tax=Yinghuangia aomiensis TaxID=676205 RepID=A0ABP9HAW0_9ACTN
MRTVFDGDVDVAYMSMYVDARDDWARSLGNAVGGQENGICGAAEPGHLHLMTGMHTGHIRLTIEIHDTAPALDDHWEDIVEASFTPETATVCLNQWGGGTPCEFALAATTYRVRYCATGMDAGNDMNVVLDGEPHVDSYLLQFWPAPERPDRVLKQTSRQAAYWHGHARSQPPPPTPEERAEAARRAAEEERERRLEAARQYEIRAWGGREPSDRLRNVRGNVHGLRLLDVHLAHALDAADPAVRRRIARWAVRRAFEAAGLAQISWIAPALDALDAGDRLPEPFDDLRRAFDRVLGDPGVPRSTVVISALAPREISRQAVALPALTAAAEPDALHAAVDAVYAAASSFGADGGAFLAEVRRAFPELGDVPDPPDPPVPTMPPEMLRGGFTG